MRKLDLLLRLMWMRITFYKCRKLLLWIQQKMTRILLANLILATCFWGMKRSRRRRERKLWRRHHLLKGLVRHLEVAQGLHRWRGGQYLTTWATFEPIMRGFYSCSERPCEGSASPSTAMKSASKIKIQNFGSCRTHNLWTILTSSIT